MDGLRLENIHKSFDATRALEGVTLEVNQGEIVAVLGPSGCGKSTLLAIIAGLISADQGSVLWAGESLADTPPHLRAFGLMFQDFALFPHMNVFANIAFGLRMAKKGHSEIAARVTEVLELVGLDGFADRDVNTLSGGEQQRVALARSLAPRPKLLMLDEPLGSLDRNLRAQLVLDLGNILHRAQQTAIYVTHDQEEAFALADRVVIMNAGCVEQTGSPQTLYHHPASEFVARFLGLTNIFPGIVVSADGKEFVATPLGDIPVKQAAPGPVAVLLRPDAVTLNGAAPCQMKGRLVKCIFHGSTRRATILVNDVYLTFDFLYHVALPGEGENVQLGFDPQKAVQLFRSKRE